jgi:hypothetical protein
VGPTVKLYWRLLEVYFSVNDVHRVILGLLLLYFCKNALLRPSHCRLAATWQPGRPSSLRIPQETWLSLSLSFSGANLVVDQEPAGSIEQLVSYL